MEGLSKTPDEIKRGLEYCGHAIGCFDCIYFDGNECEETLEDDALAYIQQLERERDALLEIVRNEADCKVCKHLKEECDGDCSFCEIEGPCACARCTTKDSHWEWAGIKEVAP